jgi:hypothetical protein
MCSKFFFAGNNPIIYIYNIDIYFQKPKRKTVTKEKDLRRKDLPILEMNHDEPKKVSDNKNQYVCDKTPESTTPQKEESLPPPQPPAPRELVSIKKWSENKQRYFYKPKDPDYAKNHYWKHKHDMQCATCGAIVTTAMFRHVKSLRCLMVKDAVKKALDNAQIEGGEALHQTKTQ